MNETLLIKTNAENSKILKQLAEKLGGKALLLDDEALEDFVLGTLMDKVKTNEIVSREEVMKKLMVK